MPRIPIMIRDHMIHPSHSHKFIGVIIDENLNFKEHVSYALAKGTKYMMACNQMIHLTKGICSRLMKSLYKGVIISKMLYAADIWCSGLISKGRGKLLNGKGARGFTSQMARVQRMATLLMTRGMRSTASDLLDTHTNILPFQQTLQKICFKATLRMATLPNTHPLAKGISTTYNFCVKRQFGGHKRHLSPLHKLMNEFKIDPHRMETILPTRHYPKWAVDVNIQIAHKKEEAEREDKEADKELRAYSDGSAIDGGV
ncbi:uncharacterized protein EDB91DRAFT_1060003 [Suillus paluster]|uniref:uncharacterized protein n=1 Tax=Suillus paluster TaxID=48578 RepID=UPI001B8697B7|nr:uncharacterized protein EDB91DRAFT_1060003 [Suillus paluster]KAG1729344.1 hypothetical protein EDB91DRAFT_1060003 [Suillus paluster]